MYPDRATATNYYYGSIWPKLSVALPIGLAKATVAFQGEGQLAKKP